jgi:phosphoribosylformimino-5-aminoimidazole carboxamide ribonucleotide (ProFAR) isomerase
MKSITVEVKKNAAPGEARVSIGSFSLEVPESVSEADAQYGEEVVLDAIHGAMESQAKTFWLKNQSLDGWKFGVRPPRTMNLAALAGKLTPEQKSQLAKLLGL